MVEDFSNSMHPKNSEYLRLRRRATLGFIIIIIVENMVNQATMIVLAKTPLSAYESLVGGFSGTNTAFTLAGAFYNFGKLILIIPLALWSDKLGRRKTLLLSFSFSVISFIILFFTTSLEIVYVARLLLGTNSFIGVVTALINDYYPENERGRPIGYISAAMLIGYLMGSLFGPAIFTLFESRYSFLFLDGIVLLSFLNVFLNIHDNPVQFDSTLKVDIEDDPEKRSLKIVVELFRDPKFTGFIMINFFSSMVFLGSGIYWTDIILDEFGASGPLAGLWFLPPVVADVGTYIFIPILFRNRLEKVIPFVFFLGIPASIILVLIFIDPTIVLFTIAGVVFGILNSAVIQSNDTMSLNYFPEEKKSSAIGIYKFFTIGSAVLGPPLFGLVADVTNPFFPLIFFEVMLVIVGILYWALIQKNTTSLKFT
ncbi:MAG: MFS transporter [Candidatus Lokiarchaeota archaeon]|nr:MFS transporter [Candidatus Lokiarchaeota archaeon]